jgi:hypothetical protein
MEVPAQYRPDPHAGSDAPEHRSADVIVCPYGQQ